MDTRQIVCASVTLMDAQALPVAASMPIPHAGTSDERQTVQTYWTIIECLRVGAHLARELPRLRLDPQIAHSWRDGTQETFDIAAQLLDDDAALKLYVENACRSVVQKAA